jgi:hypothetical protein
VANEAVIDIKANNKTLERGLDESEALVKKFATGVKVAAAGIAAAFAIGAIKNTLSSWISDASEAQGATAKLAAVIESTGGTAGYSADQLALMADELEKLTGIQAETIQQAQTLLLTFDNVRGDQFQRATELAADLATTLGTDVTGAARIVGKALDDPVDAVNALARAGVDFTAEQKEMIQSMAEAGDVVGAQTVILDALEGKVGGVAEAMGQTFAGKLAILDAKFSDLGESIGGAIIPYLEALIPVAEIAVEGFQEIIDIIGGMFAVGEEFQTSFTDVIIDGFKYVVTAGVDTFTYLQATMETWSLQSERATFEVYEAFVSLFENLKHWFTVALPEYINWFGNNWQNILTDMANYTATVFTNMWTNISSFFSNVWKWLSGEEASWEFVGLTDGFESSLQELPRIAERELSETEKYLKSSIAQMDREVAKTFDKRQQEGRAFIEKIFTRDKKEKTKFETNESQERRKLGKGEKEEKDKADKKEKEKKDAKEVAGTLVGVEEMARKIEEASAASMEAVAQVAPDMAGLDQPATVKDAKGNAQLDYTNLFNIMIGKLDESVKELTKVVKAVEEVSTGVV